MQNTINFQPAAEIVVRYNNPIPHSQMRKVSSSKDAADILREIWPDTIEFREESFMILLNRANHVLGFHQIGIGGMTGVVMDPKLIFSVALKCHAAAIIVAHNHPSGNLQPSDPDRRMTTNLVEAGKFLELQVLDHIILTKEGYYSFADDGKI